MINITQEKIYNKIKSILTQEEDLFGVKQEELLKFLSFEYAQEFIKEEYREEYKDKFPTLEPTKENVFTQIIEYLPFAWMKANDERGLSANRSIDHFAALLWLLDDGSLEKMEAIEYEHYGKEKLIFVSELVGFDWQAHDNGERVN